MGHALEPASFASNIATGRLTAFGLSLGSLGLCVAESVMRSLDLLLWRHGWVFAVVKRWLSEELNRNGRPIYYGRDAYWSRVVPLFVPSLGA